MYHRDVDAVIPVISLVTTKPDLLKSAFNQFKAWIDATGPDALNVEILYSGLGYDISFGPNHRHLIWRTIGVDQLSSPMTLAITYIKRINSRHPIVDDLAKHAKNPVAPVTLSGAHYIGQDPKPRSSSISTQISPIADCPDLLLLRVPVYKTADEVPKFSGLMTKASPPSKAKLAQSRKQFDKQARSPSAIFAKREKCIASLMPATLHMLRTFRPLQEKLTQLEKEGVERWQLEQAIVNQRLWSLSRLADRPRFQNANDLHKAVDSFLELDSPDWALVADDREALLKQVLRDARVLLRAVGAKASTTLSECQAELRARGYLLQPGDSS